MSLLDASTSLPFTLAALRASATAAVEAQNHENPPAVRLLEAFDPLKIVEELVSTTVIILVLFFAWKYRDRLLVLLTGDDRIHGTILDCIWWTFCRCCGQCTHEWTRWLTCCCPGELRNSNLVKAAGTSLGLASNTVEISNLVVGDLPYHGSYGSFYLSIECAANPPIKTSLMEDQSPKVVHFPEVVTLRIKDSLLEGQVRISVRELNVVGSAELCEVYLGAMNVVQWAKDPEERLKRFAMKPMDRAFEAETPPWIALEFSVPRHDLRQLHRFNADTDYVRTATWDQEAKSATMVQDMPVADFKRHYTLVDTTGNVAWEPREEKLWWTQTLRCFAGWLFAFCHLVFAALVVGYSCARFYVNSCHRHYKHLTMAQKLVPPGSFPISTAELLDLVNHCNEQMEGTGISPGEDPCRPAETAIQAVCHAGVPNQPMPRAFEATVLQYTGLRIHGAPCADGVCELETQIAWFDTAFAVVCVAVVVYTFCCLWPCFNKVVADWRRNLGDDDELPGLQRQRSTVRGRSSR